MTGFAEIFEPVLDFALPPRCASCGEIVPDADGLCHLCWQHLDFLTGKGCALCGAEIPKSIEICAPCLDHPPDHDGAAAAVVYGAVSRAIILRFKHGRRIGLARFVAKAMARHLPSDAEWLLVPVPLHRWRIWSRGFNQSLVIANTLSHLSGFPALADGLVRSRHTPILGGLGAKERSKTVRGAFAIKPGAEQQIAGRNILLIDDVYTSGATANACARALKRAKARSVRVICWARVHLGTDSN